MQAKRLSYALVAFLLVLPFQNCDGAFHSATGARDESSFSATPSYNELYTKIFAVQCLACHGAGSVPDFSSYAALMAGSSIQASLPHSSQVYLRTANKTMPPGAPLSDAQINAIFKWIEAGAPEGGAIEPQPEPTVPATPANLAAVSVSATQINLSWTDAASNETGYVVERATAAGGPYTIAHTLGAGATSVQDTGLTSSTAYYYRVYAYNALGNSAFSDVATATTMAPPAVAPIAPSALALTVISQSQINLAWTDNANNETGFYIERSLDGVAFTQIAMVNANIVTYSSTGLNASTTYHYRVRAYNTAGNSLYSNIANAMTLAMPVAPAAPTALAAVAASSSQINLSWTDNANNETGYYIERSTNGNTYTQIASLGANVVTYQSTGLTASTLYYYRVRAFNAVGNSNYSNAVNVMTLAPPVVAPVAPTALAATVVSSTQINLAWMDNANNETGYYVERSLNGVTFTQIASLAANVNTYQSGGLTAATQYYYRVRAFNTAGDSANSNVVNATTQMAPQPPAAPSALMLTVVSMSQINLAWTDNSANELGFYIERSPDGTNFTQIASAAANATTYSNTGLTAGTQYWYRVRSYNAAGNSAYTTVVNATTQAAVTIPTAPTALVLTPVSATQINVAWSDNSNNETGFILERATAVGGPYTAVATLGPNVTSYSNTGLSPAIVYYYRLAATSTAGNSAFVSSSAQTWGTWAWVSANILVPKCLNCHGTAVAIAGYDFSTYASTKAKLGATAAQSEPWLQINSGNMPQGGAKLPAAHINAMKTWIDNGSPNN